MYNAMPIIVATRQKLDRIAVLPLCRFTALSHLAGAVCALFII